MSSVPPGWYPDPYGLAPLRWWDGTAWTTFTHAHVGTIARTVRLLPWKPWLASATAILVAGVTLFGHAESTTTPDPGGWYAAGFASLAAIVLTTACLTLARRPWRNVAVFATVAAVAAALALFTVTAPATSRSCDNAGQPKSSGTYECDTSNGLGAPLLVALLFIPSVGVCALGKVTGDVYCAVRDRVMKRPRS